MSVEMNIGVNIGMNAEVEIKSLLHFRAAILLTPHLLQFSFAPERHFGVVEGRRPGD